MNTLSLHWPLPPMATRMLRAIGSPGVVRPGPVPPGIAQLADQGRESARHDSLAGWRLAPAVLA